MKKIWIWYKSKDPRSNQGFLAVDEDTGDIHLTPEEDHYCGTIKKTDAVLLALEILGGATQISLQGMIRSWVQSTFGEGLCYDVKERGMRFGEEAIELLQATEQVSREDLHKLVDYVYDRPAGKVEQELGGTMLTLNALAASLYLSPELALRDEFHRVLDPLVTETIKKKQALQE
jgi:hypothetical protein